MEAYHAEGRRRRTRRIVILCVVAVLLLAAIAIFVTRNQAGPPGRSASAGPTASNSGSSSSTAAGTAPGGQASPSKITVAGLFPDARLVADGMTFTRVTSQVDARCSLAANGAFAAALTSAGCEQVVRVTFVNSTRQYAVTAGVAVLPSLAAAQRANDSKSFGPDIWFTGLNGPPGSSTALITKSGGYGYDVVDGRYILFAFTANSNGRSPTGRGSDLPLLTSLSSSFTQLEQQSIDAHAKS
jgi:hypothetical protein